LEEFSQSLNSIGDTGDFSFVSLCVNLTLCIIASFILRYVFIRRSISLSGKFHIGTVIPILSVVTLLVIMVVKSSLALSLGLVGALSIVRFRTPIKEPEELVYLFLAIALGLGYGAEQTLLTTFVYLVLMCLVWGFLSRKPTTQTNEYNLLINWDEEDVSASTIIRSANSDSVSSDLLKYSSGKEEQSLFMKVDLPDLDELDSLRGRVLEVAPTASFSFYEARPLQ
jgi:hypothetical protein